ncbi:MAG TPA: hypothetical protein VFV65_04050, partial [Gemmatimonadales bacterium]|nr:hypothetical protein [Gemmatimonadales bacterium]
TDPTGRIARYPAMLAARDSVTGAMRIPVEPADLAVMEPKRSAPAATEPKPGSPSPRPAPKSAEQSNPLGRILPVH